jgi:diguanylate cyclase (GGDEF)-like protein
MKALCKSYSAKPKSQSVMPTSLSEILHQERARLLCAAANLFASTEGKDGFAGLFAAANNLRQSVTNTLERRAGELSKEELIGLQSHLHFAVDELSRVAIENWFAQHAERLARLAERDPLTQLPNRAAFERRLRDETLRARRYGREFSVVLFDVDRFKLVNDRFGHPAGDRVLAAVAHNLQQSLRQSDAVFRYGGDEFIALCPETPGRAMESLLKRIEGALCASAAQAEWIEGVGVSWGVASFPADATDAQELIRLADRRLYDRKKEHHRRAAART